MSKTNLNFFFNLSFSDNLYIYNINLKAIKQQSNHCITKDTPIFCYVQENKQNFIAKFKDNQSIINITLDTTTQKDEDNLMILQNPKNIFLSFIPFKDNQEANNTIAQKLQLTTQDLNKGYKDIDFRIPLLYLKDCEMFREWREEIEGEDLSGIEAMKEKKYPLAHSPLADLIGKIESQNKYTMCNYKKINSKGKIYYGATDFKGLIALALKEVIEKQNKKEMFATGRFQIVLDTLKAAKATLNLNENDLYNEETQDRIFEEYLIDKKRPDVMKYLKDNGDIDKAAYALAKEFASIGVKEGWKLKDKRISNGKQSYYEDWGGNKMLASYDEIVQVLKKTKEQYGDYIKTKE